MKTACWTASSSSVSLVEPAADLGVLALVVLPHDDHVDLGRRAVGERRADAAEEPDGPRLTYWRKVRRIGMRRPHRETWSGTPGAPTAPRKIASQAWSWSSPSSGIIRPVFLKRSQLQSNSLQASSKPNRRAAASRTRWPSGTTSLPIPSPGNHRDAMSHASPLVEAGADSGCDGRIRTSSRHGPSVSRPQSAVNLGSDFAFRTLPTCGGVARRMSGWRCLTRSSDARTRGERPGPGAPARSRPR